MQKRKPRTPAAPLRASELPKVDVTPEVKAALHHRRAETGLPCWKIADNILRAELGLRPRPEAAA